ncbi:FecR family protein [Pedobacter sp.]|jgi:transmembrane sensor|uniref:FecR family protein n=1 Tax=Pedobacter sp. TaxID=1411316 RepID=UPI002B58FC2A|nr:FecR family protein [Pedobacter sp.]HWW38225.1 FecR family protein [Pedobacter sp.]
MNDDKLNNLIQKYLNGSISEPERKELQEEYDRQSSQPTEWLAEHIDESNLVKERIRLNIKKEIFTGQTLNSRVKHLYRLLSAAAVLSIAIGTGWFMISRSTKTELTAAVHKERPNLIKPGTDKALLILADGKQIVLDNAKPGNIINSSGTQIIKTKEGQLVYSAGEQKATGGSVMNTLSTPRGGQYKILLPDGTLVWLNALSSLKFPAVFAGNERRVELAGEAYFEVAKDKKHPFKVKTALQEVEVLGTHFNVMAYENESLIRTTLLEGSVRIHSKGQESLLHPGQESVLEKSKGNIVVKNVSIEEAIAWKNGFFMFVHEDIHSILNKISRWYDVDIVYQSQQLDNRYSGTISKFDEVTEVLKTMEMTGTVHFKIQGRRIYVMD